MRRSGLLVARRRLSLARGRVLELLVRDFTSQRAENVLAEVAAGNISRLNTGDVRLVLGDFALQRLACVLQFSDAFVVRKVGDLRLVRHAGNARDTEVLGDVLLHALLSGAVQTLGFLELRFGFDERRLLSPFERIEIGRREVLLVGEIQRWHVRIGAGIVQLEGSEVEGEGTKAGHERCRTSRVSVARACSAREDGWLSWMFGLLRPLTRQLNALAWAFDQ